MINRRTEGVFWMNRKKYWLLGVVMLFIVLLAACGSGQQAGAGSDLTTQTTGMPSTAPESIETTEPPETATNPSAAEQDMAGEPDAEASAAPANMEENTGMKMNVQIGDSVFTATLERNSAVDALAEMMEKAPVTIQMSDYAGFEKVGSLGTSLPTSNRQTTTQAGDIVLYQGNQIVIFYGSNSWSYTRLGKIDDLTGWEEALGSGNITATFSLEG